MANYAGRFEIVNGRNISYKCFISPIYPVLQWMEMDYINHNNCLALYVKNEQELVNFVSRLFITVQIHEQPWEIEHFSKDFTSLKRDGDIVYFSSVPYLDEDTWEDMLYKYENPYDEEECENDSEGNLMLTTG